MIRRLPSTGRRAVRGKLDWIKANMKGAQDDWLWAPGHSAPGCGESRARRRRPVDHGEAVILIRRVRGRRALVQSIAKGRLLHHGTSAPEDFTDLDGPAWVSDSRDVAEWFAQNRLEGGPLRILTFRVVGTITTLARPRTQRELQALMDELGQWEGGSHDMAEAVCTFSSRYNGWIIPNNYATGADIMLCRPMDWLEFVSVEPIE